METTSHTLRTGFVAVMGRPNVGKSTLVNALLGQKVAAVSPRAQTTRRRQLGILTTQTAQVVFVDTPGLHNPRHLLGEGMNEEARKALEHCDLVLFVADGSEPVHEEDHLLARLVIDSTGMEKVLLVLNKVDALRPTDLDERQGAFMALLPGAQVYLVSATRGDGRPELLQAIVAHLPEGDLYYPEEQVTDLYEREIAADLIREACLLLLRDEVPHGVAVRMDEYTERGEDGAYIEAVLFVERESHKGIVIGKGGAMLKKIGEAARREIEAMSGRKVFLRLQVKVRKDWRDDEKVVKGMFR